MILRSMRRWSGMFLAPSRNPHLLGALMARYVRNAVEGLRRQAAADLLAGRIAFEAPQPWGSAGPLVRAEDHDE